MRRRKQGVLPLEEEHDIEANFFAIELLLEEDRFRREVGYLISSPMRQQDYRGAIDLLDDPIIPQLAKKFVVTEQLIILRLCMLGYFAPYVKGS